MSLSNNTTLIIGAGLCGLTLAYRLQESGYPVMVIEARNRVGGRIDTILTNDGTPIEMGATWLGRKHTALVELLQSLALPVVEQYLSEQAIYEPLSTSPPQLVQLPNSDDPSYRIGGGSTALIQKLAAALTPACILLGEEVRAIHREEEVVRVTTTKQTFRVGRVVSTLPPHLLFQSIAIEPMLPQTIATLASNTHTWMGESIKFGFSYAAPFWRSAKTSGTLFSNVGPVNEMYDHSRMDENRYALKGFLSTSYRQLSQDERRNLILSQLRRYYGKAVDAFTDYQDRVWSEESFTYKAYDTNLLPHQNNGHQAYRKPYWDGRFFVAGSETAAQFPGYMDGAVRSADWVFAQINASV